MLPSYVSKFMCTGINNLASILRKARDLYKRRLISCITQVANNSLTTLMHTYLHSCRLILTFLDVVEPLFISRKAVYPTSQTRPQMFSVFRRLSVHRKTCRMTPRLTGIMSTSRQQNRQDMPVQGCTVKLNRWTSSMA